MVRYLNKRENAQPQQDCTDVKSVAPHCQFGGLVRKTPVDSLLSIGVGGLDVRGAGRQIGVSVVQIGPLIALVVALMALPAFAAEKSLSNGIVFVDAPGRTRTCNQSGYEPPALTN